MTTHRRFELVGRRGYEGNVYDAAKVFKKKVSGARRKVFKKLTAKILRIHPDWTKEDAEVVASSLVGDCERLHGADVFTRPGGLRL